MKLEKYYPVLATIFIILAHLVWLKFGKDIRPYTSVLFGSAIIPTLILIDCSKKHYFCGWHRVLLWNVLINSVLAFIYGVLYRRGIEFPLYGSFAIVISCISLLIAAIMHYKHGRTIQRICKGTKKPCGLD